MITICDKDGGVQHAQRVTDSLPADTPDTLVELAADLAGDCDRCFTVAVNALLDGLAPATSAEPVA